ncbi:hypothetical protein [Chryseobacterium sp.]|uniref:hypothetical protein n=1 Tax=Chryseobacterium sp. TaxID=1871047 RepID=UPI0011C7A93A|nr:hypothetical protein [Chryseobacterium sp.]TXF79162.1 hypothetical protein FUA25_01850 [Chryseobacterium sp.]
MNFLSASVLLILNIACTAILPTAEKATVIRDCTGTYLRMDKKDFKVCNNAVLKNYKEGVEVTVKFAKTDSCPEFNDKAVCMMYHENEGTVRISEVK